jgi:DNA-binding response OmpR family regulator
VIEAAMDRNANDDGPASTGQHGGGRALRFVVVDDKVDTANSIADILTASGFAVWIAYDGVTAIELAKQVEPDVMLVDLAMPSMNGWEVARRCRKLARVNPLRLVAISGLDQDVHRKQSMLAGFDEHVIKPVTLHALAALLALDLRR